MSHDDHDRLRGHIRPDAFLPGPRQAWRATRYQEALAAHHAYSTDRPALLRVMSGLIRAFVAEAHCPPAGQRTRILDLGSGTGEVSGRLLADIPARAGIDYLGLDQDRALLDASLVRLRAGAGSAEITLRVCDFAAPDWHADLGAGGFHMTWLIHSGYYVERDHAGFIAGLERLADPDGCIVFIHNPEGNAPFRHAAEQLGLPHASLRYPRRIEPPPVPDEVFAALAGDPGDLDAYSRRFAALPEARAMRLMLEFYLPEYPLEGLSRPDRATYVENWRRHLASNAGRFANQHEMLVMWPRRHCPGTRAWLESYLRRQDEP